MAPSTATSTAPSMANTTQSNQDRKAKTIFQLDTPFSTTQWPQVSSKNQDTILEVLCSLLSPIGQHRTTHIIPSKGKRSKKRKRQEAKKAKEQGTPIQENQPPPPPPPEIVQHIVVGLRSITRLLESSSRKLNPIQQHDGNKLEDEAVESPEHQTPLSEDQLNPEDTPPTPPTSNKPFAAIFTSHTTSPGILHSHLPQLIATASSAHPTTPPTRLIQLPQGSEERLCQALCLPRVSCIGILEDAPFCTSLIDLIRECVPPVEVPWLKEVRDGKYLPLKIHSIQTVAPVGKKGRSE